MPDRLENPDDAEQTGRGRPKASAAGTAMAASRSIRASGLTIQARHRRIGCATSSAVAARLATARRAAYSRPNRSERTRARTVSARSLPRAISGRVPSIRAAIAKTTTTTCRLRRVRARGLLAFGASASPNLVQNVAVPPLDSNSAPKTPCASIARIRTAWSRDAYDRKSRLAPDRQHAIGSDGPAAGGRGPRSTASPGARSGGNTRRPAHRARCGSTRHRCPAGSWHDSRRREPGVSDSWPSWHRPPCPARGA